MTDQPLDQPEPRDHAKEESDAARKGDHDIDAEMGNHSPDCDVNDTNLQSGAGEARRGWCVKGNHGKIDLQQAQ